MSQLVKSLTSKEKSFAKPDEEEEAWLLQSKQERKVGLTPRATWPFHVNELLAMTPYRALREV